MSTQDNAPSPGDGDVEVKLDGHPYILRATLDACRTICGLPGGLYGTGSVTERILACDFDTMARIIRIGIGVGPAAVKTIDEHLFREGLLSARNQILIYTATVANGGRKIDLDAMIAEANGEGGADENPQSSASVPASTTET